MRLLSASPMSMLLLGGENVSNELLDLLDAPANGRKALYLNYPAETIDL